MKLTNQPVYLYYVFFNGINFSLQPLLVTIQATGAKIQEICGISIFLLTFWNMNNGKNYRAFFNLIGSSAFSLYGGI